MFHLSAKGDAVFWPYAAAEMQLCNRWSRIIFGDFDKPAIVGLWSKRPARRRRVILTKGGGL